MDPQTLLSRLRTLASAFSTTQLVTLAGTFVLVVGIVAGSAWWLNAPTYTLLYSVLSVGKVCITASQYRRTCPAARSAPATPR